MKIWLDDLRLPPTPDWLWCKSHWDLQSAVEKYGLPELISFDHDLGRHARYIEQPFGGKWMNNESKNGFACAKWLVHYCMDNHKKLPDWEVHSANPVGAENIRGILKNYQDFQNKPSQD